MRIVTAFFATGGEFLRDFRAQAPEFDGPALLCRTRMPLAEGELVVVDVRLPGVPNPELLRARVAGPGPDQGVWIVLAREDQATLDFLVAHAKATSTRAHLPSPGGRVRRAERFPVEVPCDFRVAGSSDRVLSSTADLSSGGAFVRAASPPPVGTIVVLELPATASGPLAIEGRVAWRNPSAVGGGMGLTFARASDEATRRLREMLRHVSERGRVELAAS